jgi:hypothetical protein
VLRFGKNGRFFLRSFSLGQEVNLFALDLDVSGKSDLGNVVIIFDGSFSLNLLGSDSFLLDESWSALRRSILLFGLKLFALVPRLNGSLSLITFREELAKEVVSSLIEQFLVLHVLNGISLDLKSSRLVTHLDGSGITCDSVVSSIRFVSSLVGVIS